MFEIGRVCLKIAGRDANNKCVIIDVLDSNYVLIDGQTRRKKCNIDHLEPLPQIVEIEKNALHDKVVKAMQTIGVVCEEKKMAKANKTKKPLQKRGSRGSAAKQKVQKVKAEKKEKAQKSSNVSAEKISE